MPNEILFHVIGWGTPLIPQAVILTLGLYKEYPPPQGYVEFQVNKI